MDYYGDIVDVKDDYQLIGLGEVGISSEESPILVTTNINTCVAVLLITKECALMLHINFGDTKDYSKSLSDISQLLKTHNGNIDKIQMFLGGKTSLNNIEELKELFCDNQFNVEIYKSYLDGDNGSIAYHFKQDKYYGVDSDRNFRDYLLGADNKRKDPMEEIYNSNNYSSI